LNLQRAFWKEFTHKKSRILAAFFMCEYNLRIKEYYNFKLVAMTAVAVAASIRRI
jgi:hypothetical protein